MTAAEKREKTHAGKRDCQEFWNAVEGITGFVLPAYIRNILKFHGFDNAMSVKLIDEDDIRAIENFTKSDEMLRILTSDVKGVNLKDYYGPFVESRPDFQILRGYRKVLMGISAFIREKGTQNVYGNVELIKNSDNGGNTVFQSIENAGPLNLKDDYLSDNSVKCNDINCAHLPVAEARAVLIPRTTTNNMKGSSKEDASTNDISFKSTIKEEDMGKITVRRMCVVQSSSNRHPYGKGWPQKGVTAKSTDDKDLFNTSARSELKSLKMDFKFSEPQEGTDDSVKNDYVGFIHRTLNTTTSLDDTDKMNRSTEEDVSVNGVSFKSTIKETEMPKITVRRMCVLQSPLNRHPYGKRLPKEGRKTKSNGNGTFLNVSTQSDCKHPKMDPIDRNQNA